LDRLLHTATVLNMTDPTELLSTVLAQAAGVIVGVRTEQAALPTPCSAWNVAALVNHLLDDIASFTVMAEGGQADWSAAPSTVPFDMWTDVFAAESRDLLAAWGAAPAGARGDIDMQLAEVVAHAWDIAKATGQSVDLNADAAAKGLEWSRNRLMPEHRGSAFGPEVTIADDAPVVDRLVGWFGRNPAWGPPA
jgi:uncharacterized protein (TIGR03086 family)